MSSSEGRDGRYKMGTFSRLTGMSAAVLRAWERRYDLLDPERMPGGHRMYTEDDLNVILRVKELLQTGRSIGEIALRGRSTLLGQGQALAGGEAARPAHRNDQAVASLKESVVRAAMEIDGDLLRDSLDEAFSRVSPRQVVERVIEPAAREIGARWATGELSVAGEHLVSSHLIFRLKHLLESANKLGRERRPVLCACLPEENHEIGLLVVALRLATVGHHLVYLGAMLPFEDLERACERLKPFAACLSVSRAEMLQRHRSGLISVATRWNGYLKLHLGGRGVSGSDAEFERTGVALWPPSRALDELLEALARERATTT